MPTVKATFGGGIPSVNLDQVPTIPCCFLFQLGHKLTPSDIADGFCKTVILDHVLDLQALNADRLVLTDQACRELMQEVTASLSDTGVYASYLFTSLDTVLATLVLPGVSSLCFRQLLFIFMEELGITNRLTCREDDERFQAQVSTYRLFHWLKLLNILFNQDGHEVAICTVFRDGNGTRLCSIRQGSRPDECRAVPSILARDNCFPSHLKAVPT